MINVNVKVLRVIRLLLQDQVQVQDSVLEENNTSVIRY